MNNNSNETHTEQRINKIYTKINKMTGRSSGKMATAIATILKYIQNRNCE